MHKPLHKPLLAISALLLAGMAQAHTGHGLPGSAHWHASDTLPLLGLAAACVVGLWLNRKK